MDSRFLLSFNRRRESIFVTGFSLIELLVVIFISSLIMLYAIPGYLKSMERLELESRVSQLLSSIQMAKIESIKTSGKIILCRKKKYIASCDGRSVRGTYSWSNGWLVFEDKSGDGIYSSALDRLIHQVELSSEKCSDIHLNIGTYVNFKQFTLLKHAGAGTFSLTCGAAQAKIIMNWLGRVRRE